MVITRTSRFIFSSFLQTSLRRLHIFVSRCSVVHIRFCCSCELYDVIERKPLAWLVRHFYRYSLLYCTTFFPSASLSLSRSLLLFFPLSLFLFFSLPFVILFIIEDWLDDPSPAYKDYAMLLVIHSPTSFDTHILRYPHPSIPYFRSCLTCDGRHTGDGDHHQHFCVNS